MFVLFSYSLRLVFVFFSCCFMLDKIKFHGGDYIVISSVKLQFHGGDYDVISSVKLFKMHFKTHPECFLTFTEEIT